MENTIYKQIEQQNKSDAKDCLIKYEIYFSYLTAANYSGRFGALLGREHNCSPVG